MKPRRVAVLYGTRHGQTERIARRIADVASCEGAITEALDIRKLPGTFRLDAYDQVVIAGPVHWGRHPAYLHRFVEQRLGELSRVATAFVSVSGAAASAETKHEAGRYVQEFLRRTRWRPDRTMTIGGAVPYTRYRPLTRLVVLIVSALKGWATDVTCDHDLTDWAIVDQFAREIGAPSLDLNHVA